MLKGFTKKGELKNINVSEDGELLVKSGGIQNSNIENTEDNPVPVKIVSTDKLEIIQTSDQEVVLNSSILMLSTEAQEITLEKKVTVISIANYSDTADVTMNIGEKSYKIGSNLAIDLPINAIVENISLIASAVDTKIQLLIKGVE